MVNIAILGFGVVGGGVAEVISKNASSLAGRLDGETLNIKYILDKRDFPDHELAGRVIRDYDTILADEEVLIVVETMGGSHPAYEFSKQALQAGKSVVTSNKEVVARYGAELLSLAKENGVSYLFEASVGGGIPIIRPMWQCLAANRITAIDGILNGTTNFILTKMFREGEAFETALSEAQRLGYAERDPSADVGGLDTCRKICILASLAYGHAIAPEKVTCEGIASVTAADVELADAFGYVIKLLGRSREIDGKVYCITAPFLVPKSASIAHIDDVYNGISVTGNAVGDVMFYGKGAGRLPTASAVMADVLDVIRDCRKTIGWGEEEPDGYYDAARYPVRLFVRCKKTPEEIRALFPAADVKEAGGECAFLTPEAPEKDAIAALSPLGEVSFLRVMDATQTETQYKLQ